MTMRLRPPFFLALAAGILSAVSSPAQPPGVLPQVQALPIEEPDVRQPALSPRNTGPAARSHSRYRRGRHATSRFIRRTPEVMREDAARVKRGDLFSTWSNEYLE